MNMNVTNEEAAKEAVREAMGSFMDSYAGRDGGVAFPDWLADKLCQEMPDMSREAGERLAGEIIEGIAGYDRKLADLNEAVDNGAAKEDWFAGQLSEAYADMPENTAGERLGQIDRALFDSNRQLMQRIEGAEPEGEEYADGEDVAEWNEYTLKQKAYDIGRQVCLSGIAVAANVVKERSQDEEKGGSVGDVAKDTLQDGLIKDKGEVKAAVAGAIHAAVQKRKKEEGVPEEDAGDISTETICDMAGVAVEGAEALYDMAVGECTASEAAEKTGRAAVAAGGRICRRRLEGYIITRVPFGPVVADLAGGLLDHLESPKFVDNVYRTIHDAAVAAWEGVKKSKIVTAAKRLGNRLKNALQN